MISAGTHVTEIPREEKEWGRKYFKKLKLKIFQFDKIFKIFKKELLNKHTSRINPRNLL